MNDLAPIVLFTYNRPWHTRKVLDALSANAESAESILYIYCDGAKTSATAEDLQNIEEVRKIVNAENRFLKVNVVMHEKNKGLAGSVVSGVTEIINKYGKIIVLEDDIVTSPFFLRYMNDSLGLYEKDNEVACITGYAFPAKEKFPETFFLKGAECWGWATWTRVWDQYNGNSRSLLKELEHQHTQYEFDYNGTYPHYQMLKDQIEGKNNSWAICWYSMAFLKGMLTLYPSVSLVRNIGFDGSGEHCGDQPEDTFVSDRQILTKYMEPKENSKARQIVAGYFFEKNKTPLSIRSFMRRVIKNRRVKIMWDRIRNGNIKNYKNFTPWNDHKDLLNNWGEKDVWIEFRDYTKNWKGKVLDIGCGTGKVMQELKQQHSDLRILGIEPGKSLVEQSRENGILEEEIICSPFSSFLQKNNYQYKTDYIYSIAALQYFNLTELNEMLTFIKNNVQQQAVFFLPASHDNIDHGIFLSWQTYNRMSKKWWNNVFVNGLSNFNIRIINSTWKDAECYGIWLLATKKT